MIMVGTVGAQYEDIMNTLNPSLITISGPSVVVEPEAIDQLERIARLPGARHAVGMPDLHAGPGIPIGACFAFDRIRPALVGSDAGCGARLTLCRSKYAGDALERRVAKAFDSASGLMAKLPNAVQTRIARIAWHEGVAGLSAVTELPEALRELAALEPEPALQASGDPPSELCGLGTIGGGNHFAEFSRIASIDDPDFAASLGITSKLHAVLVHSGSRGVGAVIANKWGDVELSGSLAQQYMGDLAGAVRYAIANRFLLSWRMLRAAGTARAGRIAGCFDLVHNTVVATHFEGEAVWLHRKGCAPAELNQATVVLGSRGTPSFIMRGLGQATTLFSVAHGAGRKLSRSDARARFKKPGARRALARTALGGRVLCDDPKLLFEEHPDAYKPIEAVVQALEKESMATRVASLNPLITVKK